MSETKEEYIKRHQIKKSPEHMTEYELRTEVISLRAEVNRLKSLIWNQPSEEEDIKAKARLYEQGFFDAKMEAEQLRPKVTRGWLEKEAEWFFNAPRRMKTDGWLYGLKWKKDGKFHMKMHIKEMLKEVGVVEGE